MARQSVTGGAGRSKSPVEIYINWDSDLEVGKYQRYDKTKGENVTYPFPFLFLPLKTTFCVTGWNDRLKKKIYSTEVEYHYANPVKVWQSGTKQPIVKGLWKDIKPELEKLKQDWGASGGFKFTNKLYAMMQDGTLICIELKGCSLASWIDFNTKLEKNNIKLEEIAIACTKSVPKRTGKNDYLAPFFVAKVNISPEKEQLAEDKQNIVLNYLEELWTGKVVSVEEEEESVEKESKNPTPPPNFDTDELPSDDLPF